ncbi:3TM-type holin [Novosphingobium humi]|uniref:3TM-type holin n=1 Tax=Novosphingobium humi TaxID=2282397 RepID=A0ABY7TSM0_9SPHN|nr:3TM-type holin [Novosphingobium humi]WCT75966.1 3TM-type holin [Novosphingobium humi]WJS97572.1 holin family protein [Novosphingobium humi]
MPESADPLPSAAQPQTAQIEAASPDRYISRARPSFLYLMYGMILLSLPMGLLSAISAPVAAAITNGVKLWLNSLPDGLYALFGTGYLGYTAARQWGKVAGTDR